MRHRKALILWGWQKWLAASALEMHWDEEKAKEVFFFFGLWLVAKEVFVFLELWLVASGVEMKCDQEKANEVLQ